MKIEIVVKNDNNHSLGRQFIYDDSIDYNEKIADMAETLTKSFEDIWN